MNMVFLGPPGAGKGTIAAIAKDYYNIAHISTGDLFRNNIKNKTELGKQVEAILASGSLVPDSVTIAMVRERIVMPDCEKGFILDGFPRTIAQAEALASMTDLDAVVNFVITNEEVVERLSGRRVCPSTGRIYHILFNPPKTEGKDDETGEDLIQRDDDKPEAIMHRLEVYATQTEPLINWYRERGLLRDVYTSNSMTPDKVFEATRKALG